MDTEPVISVRGEAQLEVEPEIAVVGLTVMAQDKDRRHALELLARRTRAAADLARKSDYRWLPSLSMQSQRIEELEAELKDQGVMVDIALKTAGV